MARQSIQSNSKGKKVDRTPQKRRSPEEKKSSDQTSRPILDDSTKRDIAGVIFIILAIVFMLIVALPPDNALVSDFASHWLRLGFGVGSYILPFVLAAIGITFLYRTGTDRLPTRAAIGLGIVFIALLGFVALFTPITTLGVDNTNLLFSENMLVNYGGYIGAGIAWAGITLFGYIVTGVVLVGTMLVGVLIIGFSISKLIDLVRQKKQEHDEKVASGEIQRHQPKDRFKRSKRQDAEPSARFQRGFSPDYDVRDVDTEGPSMTRPLMGRGDAAQLYWNRDESPKKQGGIFGVPYEQDIPEGATRRLSHQGYGDMSAAPLPFESPYSKRDLASKQGIIDDRASNKTVPLQPLNRRYDPDELLEAFEPSNLDLDHDRSSSNDLEGVSDATQDGDDGFKLAILREGEDGIYEEDPDLEGEGEAGLSDPLIDLDRISILKAKVDPDDDELTELPLIDDIAVNIGDISHVPEGSFEEVSPSHDGGLDDIANFNVVSATTNIVLDDVQSFTDDDSSTEDEAGADVSDTLINRHESRGAGSSSSSTAIAASSAAAKPVSSKKPTISAKSSEYRLPSMSLLRSSGASKKRGSNDPELRKTASTLQTTLSDFGIDASVVGWIAGPTVTLFEVDLPAGVRVSRITALNDDIALSLAAPGVRIFAPIPGTNYVGIEVPNIERQTVYLADVIKNAPQGPLQIAIGKDVEGNAIVSDLAKMPHLLIGGTTGSGKSVSINAMIMSILMRATPDEVRFIMIDPKRVEFTPYNGIPHLYVPVVTEAKEAASALSWGVAEMERRLKVFSKIGARNISQYNDKVERGQLLDEMPEAEKLPYIVIIIDELADLMMNVGKEVEFSISRIAQLARAAGIHLIVATQRPSTNVVTGLIKANITNRIAFNVASGIDSRVILDTPGAENLIGLGDLLLSKPELAKPQRIQGCYVSEDEIFAVVECVKGQSEPDYHSEILQTNVMSLGDTNPSGGSGGDDDPLLWDAADIIVSMETGSTSSIQRRLKVGYARAGRIMDQLEEKGIVGPANGTKPREVLVDEMELATLRAFEMQDD